jgi:hypothetical protein
MICLIAGNIVYARKWAKSQNLRDDEWFYPNDVFELLARKNFHTILVSEGIDYLSNDQLNKLLTLAWERGRRK